ncbi:MAG TPA: Holliday junction resolvase RuvX [Ktedonobacteraceae bacterium]|nr:Holliday junction resolvase RuvX [Ktedonobacteraceae bacterium]
MTRLMALDVGDVRIGVALSDASGFLASPYTTLRTSRDETQTWDAIQHMIRETEAEGLIVGLPISLDGEIHAQGARVQAFAERLQQHITIPITYWDERLSTVEAQRLLAEREQEAQGERARTGGRHSGGARRHRRKKQEIDALAAAVILQEYLDQLPGK